MDKPKNIKVEYVILRARVDDTSEIGHINQRIQTYTIQGYHMRGQTTPVASRDIGYIVVTMEKYTTVVEP